MNFGARLFGEIAKRAESKVTTRPCRIEKIAPPKCSTKNVWDLFKFKTLRDATFGDEKSLFNWSTLNTILAKAHAKYLERAMKSNPFATKDAIFNDDENPRPA